jgi:hypothetical protein
MTVTGRSEVACRGDARVARKVGTNASRSGEACLAHAKGCHKIPKNIPKNGKTEYQSHARPCRTTTNSLEHVT